MHDMKEWHIWFNSQYYITTQCKSDKMTQDGVILDMTRHNMMCDENEAKWDNHQIRDRQDQTLRQFIGRRRNKAEHMFRHDKAKWENTIERD